MKIVILFLFIIATPLAVQAGNTEEYNNCILEHLSKVKIKFATRLIKKACKENSRKLFAPSEEERAYNDCLLENLPEVEDEDAAKLIERSCREKYDS